jgi:hypothetical protein
MALMSWNITLIFMNDKDFSLSGPMKPDTR